jgi:hypothetical protein
METLEREESTGSTPEPEQEQRTSDGNGTHEETNESPQEQPQPYTSEEIETILSTEGASLDNKRLTPEGRLLMKSFQRSFDGKFKKISELTKELTTFKAEKDQQRSAAPPATLEEAYDRDPRGVINYLNSQIDHLMSEDPFAPQNVKEAEKLRRIKDELRDRSFSQAQDTGRQKETALKIWNRMLEVSPKTEHAEIERYAVNVLGYDPEELGNDTNPMTAGEGALKTLRLIKASYDQYKRTTSTAGGQSNIRSKEVRNPTTMEEGAPTRGRAPVVNMQDLIKQATETGDWSPVFRAKGLSNRTREAR